MLLNSVWIQWNCMLVHRTTGAEALGEAVSAESLAEGTEHSWGRESRLTQSLHCCSHNKHFTQPTDKILGWTCPSVLKCNLSFAGQEVTSRSVKQKLMKVRRVSRDHHPHVQGQKPFSDHFQAKSHHLSLCYLPSPSLITESSWYCWLQFSVLHEISLLALSLRKSCLSQNLCVDISMWGPAVPVVLWLWGLTMISGDVKRRQIKLSQSCSLLKAVLAQQHLKSLLGFLWELHSWRCCRALCLTGWKMWRHFWIWVSTRNIWLPAEAVYMAAQAYFHFLMNV